MSSSSSLPKKLYNLWAWLFFAAYTAFFSLTLSRHHYVSLKLNQILKGICHLCNHFEDPRWNVSITKNHSRLKLNAKFVYKDRFSWRNKEFKKGPAFYVTFNHDPFEPNIFKKIHEYCQNEKLGFESEASNKYYTLGKMKAQTNRALTFHHLVELIKIYFNDHELAQFYSCKYKNPIINREQGKKLCNIFYYSEGCDFKVKSIDPKYFDSIAKNESW